MYDQLLNFSESKVDISFYQKMYYYKLLNKKPFGEMCMVYYLFTV